jgi:serine/threonine protein kinase
VTENNRILFRNSSKYKVQKWNSMSSASSSGIRPSPYAPNIFFVNPEPGSTNQSIGLQEWSVPTIPTSSEAKYTLVRVLGYGSYSCVVLAKDNTNDSLVALKRIPDVLSNHEQTKRVLRELGVLRRIRHPNVLRLRSAFLRPSSVGQCRLISGKLVHAGVDLYIATEYAEGGDLYTLRGQLHEDHVASMMWDMVCGLRYLHRLGIWHRDVKSQNAFLFKEEGGGGVTWRVKLGDFGSSVYRKGGKSSALGGGAANGIAFDSTMENAETLEMENSTLGEKGEKGADNNKKKMKKACGPGDGLQSMHQYDSSHALDFHRSSDSYHRSDLSTGAQCAVLSESNGHSGDDSGGERGIAWVGKRF